MKTRTLLFTLLLVILPIASNAQIGKLLKNATNKAVNSVGKATAKEAGKEIDSAAMKNANQVDAADNANAADETSGGGNKRQGGLGLGKMMGGNVDLKYKDEYSFTSRIIMQVESYDNKDVSKADLYMYFSSSSPDVGLETNVILEEKGKDAPATKMIMDGENKCFIVLTESNGDKTGIISTLPDENSIQSSPEEKKNQEAVARTFTKTGNSRVIAGYKCDEYSYKDTEDNTYGKVWFTKDANLKIDKRGWQRTGMATYYGYAGFNEGILLASESYNDKGKLETKVETKEINTNFSHAMSAKGYNLIQMNLGNLGQPKK